MNGYLAIPRWRDLGGFLQGLLLLATGCSVLGLVLPGTFVGALWLGREVFLDGEVWRCLSYALPHGDLWHLLFNGLVLWFFAPELARYLGTRRFVALVLVTALAGGLAHVLLSPFPVIGLSAVVYGVMAASARYWPRRQVLVFFVIPVPFWALVAVLFVIEMLLTMQPGSPVSHWAHLGGLLTGLGLALAWRGASSKKARRKNRLADRIGFFFWKRKVARRNAMQARVDVLLDKISARGKASLTARERRFLDRASRTYRTD